MERKSDIYFEGGTRVKKPWEYLPGEMRHKAEARGDTLTEIRIRPGRQVQFVYTGGDVLGDVVSRAEFEGCLAVMMGHSLYARQAELAKGYFILPDGSRAGITGSFHAGGPKSLSEIGSACIRIAREIKGCADKIMEHIGDFRGILVVAPPGKGKTTLIRDMARQFSENGRNVCIIDERDEIASCISGVPTLDVGPRTDVIAGMEKSRAIMMAVRACAPDILVLDEIGDVRDGKAICEAARCGVSVIATVHGNSLDKKYMRPVAAEMVESGIFATGILLGGAPGDILQIKSFDGGEGGDG